MPLDPLLVVLDLDETLLHATSRDDVGRTPDFEVFELGVYRRPHLEAFLDHCFDNYRVGVWTSSGELYAAEIVNNIMPGRDLEFVWSQERCGRRFDPEFQSTHSTKPIRKLQRQGFTRERIIAIDDSPEKWIASYGNLVRVQPTLGARPTTSSSGYRHSSIGSDRYRTCARSKSAIGARSHPLGISQMGLNRGDLSLSNQRIKCRDPG